MATKGEAPDNQVSSELQDIKKLLILALLQAGVSQEKIAAALAVNQSTVSRLLAPEAKKR